MMQIVKPEISQEMLDRFPGAYMIHGEKFIGLAPTGEMIIYDLHLANQITLTDVLMRFNTDVTFRKDFLGMIERLGLNGKPQETNRAIVDQPKEDTTTPAPPQQRVTHTYLMHDPSTGLYKIGRSKDVQFRERTLAGQIPLVQTICSTPIDIEGELHSKYADCRKRGEWFDLSEDAVNEIKEVFEGYVQKAVEAA